ncbi:sodium-dependent phosphate transport 2B [Brachionus plicatilis]|uniref:Sodium-dependent phosphate transport 2B n=1 Tax=Brachionus plicatilis TaxID=10195 RepID=A0A3M7SM43_BRAPC|nr:sodium-dependent phosphate transport 2B [Brachionus plicatilis]
MSNYQKNPNLCRYAKVIQMDNEYESLKKVIQSEEEEDESDRPWHVYSKKEKLNFILLSSIKIIFLTLLLYVFLLSLNFLTIGFTLVSPHALKADHAIQFLLSNPLAALSIGILVTAVLQSATATSSIVVTMVGAGIIPSAKKAIPIIMGSNIGTCVTNSLVALTLSGDPVEFKRAFSAATLNDIFNYLTTIILLFLDVTFDFLHVLSKKITNLMPENVQDLKKANFIEEILRPVSDLFIKLNETSIEAIQYGSNNTEIASRCCESLDQDNGTVNQTECAQCDYLTMPMIDHFGDGFTGLFFIIFSLIILTACLFGIVKILSLFIVGPIARGVRSAVNASLPGKMRWLTQVILFFFAFFLTLIVQSSNIITATLVPLCGIGMVSLHRVYVMTLGSNIGTTVTGILSALTQPTYAIKKSMQLAIVNTLFNLFGVVLWLPLPFMRFPKIFSRKLGDVIYEHKWFLYVYAFMCYVILPTLVLGLVLIPHWIGLAVFFIPIFAGIVLYAVVLVLRKYLMDSLPNWLQKFDWLPEWTQLAYWDALFNQLSPIPDDKVSQQENILPIMLRRYSAIDSVVKQAMIFKRENTIQNIESSDEEYQDNYLTWPR